MCSNDQPEVNLSLCPSVLQNSYLPFSLTEHVDEEKLGDIPVAELDVFLLESRPYTSALLRHHPPLRRRRFARPHGPDQLPQPHRHGLKLARLFHLTQILAPLACFVRDLLQTEALLLQIKSFHVRRETARHDPMADKNREISCLLPLVARKLAKLVHLRENILQSSLSRATDAGDSFHLGENESFTLNDEREFHKRRGCDGSPCTRLVLLGCHGAPIFWFGAARFARVPKVIQSLQSCIEHT